MMATAWEKCIPVTRTEKGADDKRAINYRYLIPFAYLVHSAIEKNEGLVWATAAADGDKKGTH